MQMLQQPTTPSASATPASTNAQWDRCNIPEAWIYYVVTAIDGVHVPLAAMQRLGRSKDFILDACSVAALLSSRQHRDMLFLERDLAQDYYHSMRARPLLAELRDYQLEFATGFMPMGRVPRYASAHGLREFPHTSACLREGAVSTHSSDLSWCAVPAGCEGWQPVPLGTVRRLGNRTYALMVWDVTDQDNVKYGIAFNKSDSRTRRQRLDMTAPLGESWYPMSAAEVLEYIQGSSREESLAKLGFGAMENVEPETLRYICDPDTPLPQKTMPLHAKQPASLVDQAIVALLQSVALGAEFDPSVLDACGAFPGFKPSLRRILAQRPELLSTSPATGRILAAALEGASDVSLLHLRAISAPCLQTMVGSAVLQGATSLTLFAESVQGTTEEVAVVLGEAPDLEIRILRKPGSTAGPDPGLSLSRFLKLEIELGVARQRRVTCAGDGCVRLGLDRPNE